MAHPGLLAWADSIRLTMTSDPGRQFFKDQVQTHGFLFLDDYLDNIVSGATQDPLIELVKTPGRKKAISRKPKLMSSKLGTTVSSLSFEDKSVSENIVPSNSFPTVLLTAKVAESPREKGRDEKATIFHDHQSRAPLAPIQSLSNSFPAVFRPVPAAPPPIVPSPQIHSNIEHDLSIIAEDDEPFERSRILTSARVQDALKSPVLSPKPAAPLPPSSSELGYDKSQQDVNMTSSSSTATFQSISLRSPTPVPVPDEKPAAPSPGPWSQPEMPQERLVEPIPIEPSPMEIRKSIDDQPMIDAREDAQTDRKSSDRPAPPVFPSLPGPMPPRKTRDPSLNMVMQGSATPGAARGKRTSYLTKVREAIAIEGTSKKSHVQPLNISSTAQTPGPQGTKRKSGDMLAIDHATADKEDEERPPKVSKLIEGELASRKSKNTQFEKVQDRILNPRTPSEESKTAVFDNSMQEGVLDRLKKTVEDFGVRASKTMGKSFGGGAAAALAEARAAAEAKVAERDRKEDEVTHAMGAPSTATRHSPEQEQPVDHKQPEPAVAPTPQSNGRLSISDLFPTESRIKEKHKVPEKPFKFKPNVPTPVKLSKPSLTARESTSTTPPNSPPTHISSVQLVAPPPVFNKPSPVFALPVATTRQPFSPVSKTKPFSPAHRVFNPPPPQYNNNNNNNNNNAQSSIYPSLRSPTPSFKDKVTKPLTAHSTVESIASDRIFDRDDDVPAWMPSTQDTDYNSGYTQSQQYPDAQPEICDEDDSWPIDDKLAAGVQWAFNSKEDSMTWSTLPSQSTRGDTGPMTRTPPPGEQKSDWDSPKGRPIPGAFDVEMENAVDGEDDLFTKDAELEEVVFNAPKPAIPDTQLETVRSQSQMSMASIASFESSQSQPSQGGFLNQASKLLSSALGTSSKKKQPEVKMVLQKAAVAAKKQQEEADKKATRLKEMENRRQLAIQRKAEEEKAKELEEERKLKDEADRRKKEKEGNTDKRALKLVKKDDESQKKRKIEVEKKPELKKPGPGMLFGKSHLKSSLKQPSNTSFAFGSSAVASSSNLETESSTLHKEKEQTNQQNMVDDEISQPSQLVQSQMAARAKAQIDAAKHASPVVPSESIELPDINSEYSDSEDEDRVRTFDPPEWAQSPELRQALEMQSTINPDDIFGAVRPLRMEEIFKTRTSRFRARTSSANWTGTDRLTMQEESAYARRMGFK